MRTDVLVIGGGIAGLASAISAAKKGANVTLVESGMLGGATAVRIDESFGRQTFGRAMTGGQYARRYIGMLSAYPRLRVVRGVVTALGADKTAEIVAENGCFRCEAKAVVLASGSRERSIGMLDVGGTRPAGIMTAGAALKAMNVYGKNIGTRAVVLGSGESGAIVARRLTLEGVKVECVTERLPHPSVSPDMKVFCLDDYRIPLLTDTTVKEIRGEARVREIVISQSGAEKTVRCDLLVVAAGRMPLDALYSFIKRGADGSLETDSHCMTCAAGFFICGNALRVRSGADNVGEEGERAGAGAAEFASRGRFAAKAYWLTPTGNVTAVWPRRFVAGEDCTVAVRVSRPIRNGYLVLTSDAGETVARINGTFFPGDETRFRLSADDVACNLYVGAEERV